MARKKATKEKVVEPTEQPEAVVEAEVVEAVVKTEPASNTKQEQTRSETMSEERKGFFSWVPNMDMGKEVMSQLVKPWMEATAVTLEQTQKLQSAVMERSQEAMSETIKMMEESNKQYTNMMTRSHELMQEQIKRFSA
jgi:hypothetical protein